MGASWWPTLSGRRRQVGQQLLTGQIPGPVPLARAARGRRSGQQDGDGHELLASAWPAPKSPQLLTAESTPARWRARRMDQGQGQDNLSAQAWLVAHRPPYNKRGDPKIPLSKGNNRGIGLHELGYVADVWSLVPVL